jgi:hypothetical protein
MPVLARASILVALVIQLQSCQERSPKTQSEFLTQDLFEVALIPIRQQPNPLIDGRRGGAFNHADEWKEMLRKANDAAMRFGFKSAEEYYALLDRIALVALAAHTLERNERRRVELRSEIERIPRELSRDDIPEGTKDAYRLALKQSRADLEAIESCSCPYSEEEISLYKKYADELRPVLGR